MKNVGYQYLVLAVFLSAWLVVFYAGLYNPLLVPHPKHVFRAFFELVSQPQTLLDLTSTVMISLVGFASGGLLGIMMGLLIGVSRTRQAAFVCWLDFLRSIPPSALLPLFMLFLGIGYITKIALVIFLVSVIVAVSTIAGINQANPIRVMTGKLMGLSEGRILFRVLLPEALPAISTSLKICLSLSLMVVVVAEMFISTSHGVGNRIVEYQLLYETSQMYALIILVGILSYGLNKLYLRLEKKYIHWSGT